MFGLRIQRSRHNIFLNIPAEIRQSLGRVKTRYDLHLLEDLLYVNIMESMLTGKVLSDRILERLWHEHAELKELIESELKQNDVPYWHYLVFPVCQLS